MKRSAILSVGLLAVLASQAVALNIGAAASCDFSRHLLATRTLGRSKSHGGPGYVASAGLTSQTVTDCNLGYTYKFSSWNNVDPCDPCKVLSVTLRVDEFHISGRQTTTISMPAEAPKALQTHEDNHWRISNFAYKRAVASGTAYARGMLSRTFTASNVEDAQHEVDAAYKTDYHDPYFHWADAMHQAYNDAVGDKLNPKVRTEAAYQRAINIRG
ncbi:MAG: hypothetical protein JWM57_3217 [Phycisphaerales bacterium]|nr:hypothetical protein [Phycisphaerales bacterium]